MSKKITIVQGHPDPAQSHYCHALAEAYGNGAKEAGHEVRIVTIATLEFPYLHRKEDFYGTDIAPLPCMQQPKEDLEWADHMVLIFPLWLGGMPALVKGFLEQLLVGHNADDFESFTHIFRGKSARIVVTMGMPAQIYRWYFGSAGVRTLEQGILRFVGMGPIRESLIGMVEGMKPADRDRWLLAMMRLGARGV